MTVDWLDQARRTAFVGVRLRPRVWSAVLALLAALATHLTWQIFVRTASGQTLDDLALAGAHIGAQSILGTVSNPVLGMVSITMMLAGGGVAAVIALIRKRWTLVGQAALVIVGSNVTSQVLKNVVYHRPHLIPGWTGENSLPSGHTTVAASMAAAMLVVLPRKWRPVIALLGMVWAAGTGISAWFEGWHRPSDLVASMLVVLAWGAIACAASTRWCLDVPTAADPTLRSKATSTVVTLGLVGALVGVGGAGITLWDLHGGSRLLPLAPESVAYGGALMGIVGMTAGTFALLLLLRQTTSRPSDLSHSPPR